MATSDPGGGLTAAAGLDGAAASPRAVTMLAPRRIVHILYFTFAIAALLVLALMVPGQTTRAPVILAGGAALWAAMAAARYLWERRAGNTAAFALEPAHLFLVVLTSTYVVFAFDLSSIRPRFSPTSPDGLPGLMIDSHVYFALVFVYLLGFVGWYGSERGRLLETALAAQVLLLSLMFESFVFNAASVPALVLMAVALALVRGLPWEGEARAIDRSIGWLAVPLLVFLGVAVLSTSFGAYRYTSLTITTRMAVMAFLALLLFDSIREDRQRWLIWLAMTAPAVTQGALVTIKVLDVGRVMGFSYALGNRMELASGVEPNPLGLSLAIGTLMVAAVIPRVRGAGLRLAAVAALVLLLPALVVAYSVPSLMALACGLTALTVLYALQCDWRAWRRPATFAAPASFAVIGLIVVAMYTVPAATRDGLRYTVDDPTTGRSRVNIWNWSIRDFKEHPVLGVGPGYYRGRTRYVPEEFPFRDVTRMLERRRLLGNEMGQWHVLVLTHPHNLILSVAEGMGIVGLLALGLVAAAAAAAALRIMTRRNGDEWWFTSLGLALLVAIAAWSMTALGLDIAILPLAGWLALGFVALAHRTGDDRPLSMPRVRAGDRVRHGVALVAGVAVLVVFVVRPVGWLTATKIGRDRFLAGDMQRAEGPLSVAATFEPLEASALVLRSFSELQYGKTEEALETLDEARSRLPEDPGVLARLADVSWLSGDTEAAELYYRRAIASDRWQAAGRDAYTPLALLKVSEGQSEEAVRLLADGFFLNPANAFDGAWVHTEEDSSVVLDDAYMHGSDPRTNSRLLESLQGRLLLYTTTTGEPAQGTLNITEVFGAMELDARDQLGRDRERGIEMLHTLGVCYRNARLYAGARRVLEDAAALDPAAMYIRYELAQVKLAAKDDDAAISDLDEVVRLGRTSSVYDLRLAFAERDLALIAYRQERYTDATALMRQALEDYRWAYLPFAYSVLADSYEALGEPGKAAEYREKERYLTRR